MTLDISTLNHVLKSMPRLCNGQQVDSKITIYIYYTYMYRNVFVLLIFLIHPIMQIWRTFFLLASPMLNTSTLRSLDLLKLR